MVPIVIDRRLRLPLDVLPEAVVADLQARTTYPNPARHKLERLARGAQGKRAMAFRFAARKEPFEVSSWAVEDGQLTLPRGALPKVRGVLRAHGLEWRLIDNRSRGTGPQWTSAVVHRPDPKAADGGDLRWYQEAAIEAATARQNCLLRAPTGSGKTTTAIALTSRLRLPTLIVVWNGGLLAQWRDRLKAELGLRDEEIGQLGDGKKEIRAVTLAMQQTLARGGTARALGSMFGVVICDEVQRFAASTFLDVIDAFDSYYRIGISADETRVDGKEFLIYDAFGEVAHEVKQDELIDAGAVLDVECRLIPTDFRADWYVAQRDSGGSPDFNRLLDEMTANEERTALAVEVAAREVADGHQVLLLTHRVEHAHRIDAALASHGVAGEIMLGGEEWKERFDAARSGLRAGTVRAVAGTVQAVGTGIDVPSLSRGVLTTPVNANRQLYGQIRGRLCRVGKDDAVLYVLWDRHISGGAVLKRMLAWNRTVRVLDGGEWVDGREFAKR